MRQCRHLSDTIGALPPFVSVHNSSALSVSVDENVERMSDVACDDDAADGVALAPPTDT